MAIQSIQPANLMQLPGLTQVIVAAGSRAASAVVSATLERPRRAPVRFVHADATIRVARSPFPEGSRRH